MKETTMRYIFYLAGLLLLIGCAQPQAGAPSTETAPATRLAAASPTARTIRPALLPTSSVPLDVPVLEVGATAPIPDPTPVAATAAPSDPVRITIDAVELDQTIIEVGLDANLVPIVPRHEVGWYTYSARPGAGENVVLWGHVLRFRDAPEIPAPFARLHEVPIGEQIDVHTASGQTHSYVVDQLVWATPEQVDYILRQGHERLTLVSCIGDQVIVDGGVQMTHRLITIALPLDGR